MPFALARGLASAKRERGTSGSKEGAEEILSRGVGGERVPDVLAQAELGQHVVAQTELSDDHISRGRLSEAGKGGEGKLSDGDNASGRLADAEEDTDGELTDSDQAHGELADGHDADRLASDGDDAAGGEALAGRGVDAAREMHERHAEEACVRGELLEQRAVGVQESPPHAARGLFNLVLDLSKQKVVHEPARASSAGCPSITGEAEKIKSPES